MTSAIFGTLRHASTTEAESAETDGVAFSCTVRKQIVKQRQEALSFSNCSSAMFCD